MITITRTRVAEALFVSDLQPTDAATPAMVRAAVDQMIQRYGVEGCAARMASAFGDQPERAVRRMLWVHRTISAIDR